MNATCIRRYIDASGNQYLLGSTDCGLLPNQMTGLDIVSNVSQNQMSSSNILQNARADSNCMTDADAFSGDQNEIYNLIDSELASNNYYMNTTVNANIINRISLLVTGKLLPDSGLIIDINFYSFKIDNRYAYYTVFIERTLKQGNNPPVSAYITFVISPGNSQTIGSGRNINDIFTVIASKIDSSPNTQSLINKVSPLSSSSSLDCGYFNVSIENNVGPINTNSCSEIDGSKSYTATVGDCYNFYAKSVGASFLPMMIAPQNIPMISAPQYNTPIIASYSNVYAQPIVYHTGAIVQQGIARPIIVRKGRKSKSKSHKACEECGRRK